MNETLQIHVLVHFLVWFFWFGLVLLSFFFFFNFSGVFSITISVLNPQFCQFSFFFIIFFKFLFFQSHKQECLLKAAVAVRGSDFQYCALLVDTLLSQVYKILVMAEGLVYFVIIQISSY